MRAPASAAMGRALGAPRTFLAPLRPLGASGGMGMSSGSVGLIRPLSPRPGMTGMGAGRPVVGGYPFRAPSGFGSTVSGFSMGM